MKTTTMPDNMRELTADDLMGVQGGFVGTLLNDWAQSLQLIRKVATVVIGVASAIGNAVNPS